MKLLICCFFSNFIGVRLFIDSDRFRTHTITFKNVILLTRNNKKALSNKEQYFFWCRLARVVHCKHTLTSGPKSTLWKKRRDGSNVTQNVTEYIWWYNKNGENYFYERRRTYITQCRLEWQNYACFCLCKIDFVVADSPPAYTQTHTHNECYIGQYMRVWLKHTHLAKERRTTIGFTHDVTLKVYVCVCAVYLMSVWLSLGESERCVGHISTDDGVSWPLHWRYFSFSFS